MKIKIYYWSPFISKIATVKAVINSARSLLQNSNKYECTIINSIGEFSSHRPELKENKINLFNFYKRNFYNLLSDEGFLKSRFSFIVIFILSFYKLDRLLRKKKPNYLIIHLITSLPLFLNLIFNYQTKIILRISGLPKLNFFRKFFWKIAIKKIYFVTCPTEETRKFLILNNLVNKNQAIVLYDPIIDVNNNKFSKKKITYYKKNFKDYLLCVGRLTDQKNFSLMIKSFKYISSKKKNLNLVIAGEGEQRKKLIKLIKNLDLEKKVFLIGHNKDIFELFRGSKIFCLTSLWEDPGFVLIEAAFLKINIVSTKCPNGPQDFFKKTKYAYNFKTNDLRELNLKLLKIITNNYKVEHKFKKILFDKSLNYTLENHFKIIKGILI